MNFDMKNLNLLRSELIRAVGFLLMAMVIINMLAYSNITKLSYLNRLQASNDMLVRQIGISYETTLSYMADTINKISLYDFAEIDRNGIDVSAFDFHGAITKKLTSIVSLNSYIHSAYIYIPDINRIYNSMYYYPRISAPENFHEPEVFLNNHPNYMAFLEPRLLLENPSAKTHACKTVISIMAPIVMKNSTQTPYLVLNISADKLYDTILKGTDMSSDVRLYAFNRYDTIVVHNNHPDLVTTKLSGEDLDFESISEVQRIVSNNGPMVSTYHSGYLNWTFVLKSPVSLVSYKLSGFAAINITSVLFIMLIITLFIINKTKPVGKIASTILEIMWKDVLNDNVFVDERMIQQLKDISFNTENGCYGVIAVSLGSNCGESAAFFGDIDRVKGDIDNLLSQGTYQYRIVQTGKNMVAIVMNYKSNVPPAQHKAQAESIFETVSRNPYIFIGVSNLQKNFGFIALCYKECINSLNYKICLNSNVLDYALIKDGTAECDYPSELMRQLVNNITVGNEKFCTMQIDKIFAPYEQKRVLIDDTQFFNLVISIQNSILKTISAFPMAVKVDSATDITDIYSIEKIKLGLVRFSVKICNEINSHDENQEYRLFSAIMDYINKNFLSDSINVAQSAEDLSINKNYLSRIVKEMTGTTFNDYVNKKRIEHSKELLKDKSKTIEEISAEVGFNYSYYFIKIFKTIEGVTPGQYRAGAVKSEQS